MVFAESNSKYASYLEANIEPELDASLIVIERSLLQCSSAKVHITSNSFLQSIFYLYHHETARNKQNV